MDKTSRGTKHGGRNRTCKKWFAPSIKRCAARYSEINGVGVGCPWSARDRCHLSWTADMSQENFHKVKYDTYNRDSHDVSLRDRQLHPPCTVIANILLRACTQSREAPLIFVSVCPHLQARLLLEGFLWNLVLESFMKACRGSPNFVEIGSTHHALYMNVHCCWRR